jgi:protein O-GlcNAc transferase
MSKVLRIEKLRARATELHNSGQLDEAEQICRRILELHRTDFAARHMLGVLQLQKNRSSEALAILEPLLAEAPNHPDIRSLCGLARQDLGQRNEALHDFDQALSLNPGNRLALLYRGNLLIEVGMAANALECYDKLLALAPGFDEAWFRRGKALWLLDRFEDALASYKRALALNPQRFTAAFNSGTVLLKLNRYDEAFATFERAARLEPNHPYVVGFAASALLGASDFGRWREYQAKVVDGVRSGSAVIPPLVLLPFSDDGALRRACSERFAADQVPVLPAPLWTGEHYRHDRIRIAYLSADFRHHAIPVLVAGVIEQHDRTHFDVTAISFSRDDGSSMRERLMRGFDHFEDVLTRSDAEVAQMLRHGEFDIAVDLMGHTEGARPGILAHRPCPVQVNYLGYPGTSGAPWLDYIIADKLVLPLSDQAFYTEKIVHLPHCYQANDSRRAIEDRTPTRVEAGLPDQGFVFCCFNAAWKITPEIFAIWMRLLAAVPYSVLWLLSDNIAMASNLKAAAAAQGVDPSRLVFAPRVSPAEHLARHRLADLFVDTLPYNAHTTASDALWMGLPVLTSLGTQFDGRVAASLLRTVGLPELVTGTLMEYEALALTLAQEPERLAELKVRLAANRLSSPLYDTKRFCNAIEAAYLRMMEISRAGRAPESFTVPDE